MNRNDPADLLGQAGVSRRTVLAVGAAGASTIALAACSKAPSVSTSSAGTTGAVASGGTSSAAGTGTGAVLAALASVPVGSAVAAKGPDGGDIIITRTSQESVSAFSAICPHQGCTVAPSFQCPCHGSTFDPKTGAPLSGPAPTGLATVAVKVSGANIVAG